MFASFFFKPKYKYEESFKLDVFDQLLERRSDNKNSQVLISQASVWHLSSTISNKQRKAVPKLIRKGAVLC